MKKWWNEDIFMRSFLFWRGGFLGLIPLLIDWILHFLGLLAGFCALLTRLFACWLDSSPRCLSLLRFVALLAGFFASSEWVLYPIGWTVLPLPGFSPHWCWILSFVGFLAYWLDTSPHCLNSLPRWLGFSFFWLLHLPHWVDYPPSLFGFASLVEFFAS